jgi:hypothetical protein
MDKAPTRTMVVHWHPLELRGFASLLGGMPDTELVGVASTCEQARLHIETDPNMQT